ncbi:chromosome replication initiation inhibitor protein [Actinoplanes sp. NBRC 14428]|uniref:HTH-type transcriptional regulator LysG n=2 Tax=Pseudosporangium ferrugineum TaxID=439699 RepID=A0A2T0SDT7_9ACTN|nr:LysR family transcriptional regulator [Pseudosporangium ferrugineum]BCJ54271.1 chromosome replication initiation inhibitor protein [Actinoplanes sp. NBRC 14428]
MDAVQLTTFQAVIEEGSFDAAARALHVTPSAVSQRIKALEQAVGQVLVRRAKPAEPTEAGQALVRLAGQVALLEREALDAARGALGGGGRTRATVVVNADSLLTWFLTALAAVPAELALSFDLHQEDQDHTADLLRAGTAMAAVTGQHTPVQGCRVEPLGAMRYRAMAAPGAFAGFDTTPMIVFNRKDRLQHRFLASLTRRHLDPPIHYVPAAAAFVDAIRLGLGWGLVPERIADEDVAAGRLEELTPGRHLDVPLYWQFWRMESTMLAALTEAVKTAAAAALR